MSKLENKNTTSEIPHLEDNPLPQSLPEQTTLTRGRPIRERVSTRGGDALRPGFRNRLLFSRRGFIRRRIFQRQNYKRNFSNNYTRNYNSNYSYFNNRKLFVNGFGNLLNNLELNKIFSPFGKLFKCKIHYDNLGRSRGTANVEFIYPQDARRAIQRMNGARIGNNVMMVKYDGTKGFKPRFRKRFRVRRRFGFRR